MTNQTTMKTKTDYLSMKEINKMLQYCYDNGKVRDYMIIKVLSRTGRRVSEVVGTKPYIRVVGLRPCDIQGDGLIEWCILKKSPIKTKTKDGKVRSQLILDGLRIKKQPKRHLLPIDDHTLEELNMYIEHMEITPHSRVFPITRCRVNQIVHEVAKACKITRPNKKIHPHNFRHSFAINFLKANNKDPAALIHIKGLLHHSRLEVTSTYLQFTQEDKKEALNKTFGDD